jgi:hypothetical protein
MIKEEKMKSKILFLFLFLAIAYFISCGKIERYGDKLVVKEESKILEIMKNPEKFKDKLVRVKGKILRECPSGCWFVLGDDKGEIKVELMPSGFAIPQRVKREAIVEGKVKIKGNIPILIGKGVLIR